VLLFGLFIVIALSAGLTFNILTIALPKIVDERLSGDLPLILVGSIATAVLVCGALAQLTVGRLVEWIPPHIIFATVTGLGFLANLWAAYAGGTALLIALAVAIAAIYGQVTVNDMIIARYTADAWRGRVYAIRYFLLFISAGAAIGMISLLHETGGFMLVLGANAVIAFLLFVTTLALVTMIISVESKQRRPQPAE
jgi:MFS family permease